jgi:hypothetical protein
MVNAISYDVLPKGISELPKISVEYALQLMRDDVAMLLAYSPVPLADPPNVAGVYMLLLDDKVVYIGEAKGSKWVLTH